MAQRFSAAFSLGCDPGDPAWSLLLPLLVSLPLSLCVFHESINKILKIREN